MDNKEPELHAPTEELPRPLEDSREDSREDHPEDAPAASPEAPPPAPAPPLTRTEARLRKLTGRKGPYDGPIVGIARGWVSRDGRMPLFAARFLDFAVLTPDHLVLCSTGFFTRRPRRRVFKQALGRLEVVPLGSEPYRTVRVSGHFNRPIRVELRPNEAGLTFARELLACTRPTSSRADTGEPDA
jgi:hypothetical protein